MAIMWRSALRTLFNPEDASQLPLKGRLPTGGIHLTIRWSFVSAKALIWVVISILLGLALGQL